MLRCKVKSVSYLVFVGLLAVGQTGCDSNNASSADGSASDGSQSTDAAALVCDGDCSDFVVTRLLLPATPQLKQQYGYDFDGDGTNDNGLGATLASLSLLADVELQQGVDHSVAGGEAVLLARLKAASLDDATQAQLQLWLAEERDCCPTADTLDECQTEAETNCFNESVTQNIAANSPEDMLFAAQIEGGSLSAGPSQLTIRLAFSDSGPTDLLLDNARVLGDVSENGITNGVIAGTLSQQTLNGLIGSLAQILLEKIDEGGQTAEIIKGLFDANEDGIVTTDEIVNDELMDSLFVRDVDVDGDGNNEMSLGLGFEAVASQIDR